MRRLLPAIGALGLSAASCGLLPTSPEHPRLYDSQQEWVSLKAANGSSYRYTARDGSWTGTRWETTIEVLENRVTRRSFRMESEAGVELEAWEEEGSTLGAHEGVAPPLTIEGVYERCASDILRRDRDTNYISLSFHSNGLLETCTYFPKDCADDCASGVRVSSIEFLAPLIHHVKVGRER